MYAIFSTSAMAPSASARASGATRSSVTPFAAEPVPDAKGMIPAAMYRCRPRLLSEAVEEDGPLEEVQVECRAVFPIGRLAGLGLLGSFHHTDFLGLHGIVWVFERGAGGYVFAMGDDPPTRSDNAGEAYGEEERLDKEGE